MDYKIEQAILRFKKNVESNKKNDLVKFENELIRINENRSEANWVILVYIISLIITPIGILIYSILYAKDYILIGLFILIIATFSHLLRKMVIGATTLEINFNKEYIQIQNNTIFFKKILKAKKISFTEVLRCELSEKTIEHKYSETSKWQQLSIINNLEKKQILTDFNYSDYSIAKDVKLIIETIISSYKK